MPLIRKAIRAEQICRAEKMVSKWLSKKNSVKIQMILQDL